MAYTSSRSSENIAPITKACGVSAGNCNISITNPTVSQPKISWAIIIDCRHFFGQRLVENDFANPDIDWFHMGWWGKPPVYDFVRPLYRGDTEEEGGGRTCIFCCWVEWPLWRGVITSDGKANVITRWRGLGYQVCLEMVAWKQTRNNSCLIIRWESWCSEVFLVLLIFQGGWSGGCASDSCYRMWNKQDRGGSSVWWFSDQYLSIYGSCHTYWHQDNGRWRHPNRMRTLKNMGERAREVNTQ